MSVRRLLENVRGKSIAIMAFAIATFLTVSVAPTFATEPPTTRLSIHLTGQTVSGDDISVSANVLNLQVFEGNTAIYDRSAFANNGCTDDETVACSPLDWTDDQSDNIVFVDVPVSATAQYYVSYDWQGGSNLGTFDRFLETGRSVGLPNFSVYYPSAGSTWMGLEENANSRDLNLTFADDDGGTVTGSLTRLDNGTVLPGMNLNIDSWMSTSGTEYIFKGQTQTDENGEYLVGSLPVNAPISIRFSSYDQSESNPAWSANDDLGDASETVRIRPENLNRIANVYVPVANSGSQPDQFPSGDLNYSGTIVDQNGDPVVTGITFDAVVTAGNGAIQLIQGTTPTLSLDNVTAGDYRITVSGTNLFPSASSTVTIPDSLSTGETWESNLSVVPFPTGAATISGVLDVIPVNVEPAEPAMSISVVSFADPDPELGNDYTNFARSIRRDSDTGEWQVGIYDDSTDTWTDANLPDGRYRIHVESPNWVGNATWSLIPNFTVDIVDGVSVDTGTRSIEQLIPSDDVLNVKLKDSVTRLPVGDITCYAYIYSDEMFTSVQAVTNTEGIATITGVFRGATYNISCWGMDSLAGFAIRKNAVQIHEGTNNVIMSMDRHQVDASVVGRVVDANGDPIAGVRVSATQTFELPDCQCGDGMGFTDLTDAAGTFDFGMFAIDQAILITVEDPRGILAKTVVRLTPGQGGPTEIGDLTLQMGADLGGTFTTTDTVLGSRHVTLIASGFEWGNSVSGEISADGIVTFDEAVPAGDYNAFVEIMNDPTGGDPYVRGWIDQNGNLTAAKSDARDFNFTPSSTDMGTYNAGIGSTITGHVRFVDGAGRDLTSWTYWADVKLYVLNSDGDWEFSNNLSTYVNGGDGGTYSIGGLPDGHYKVCFTDPYSTINRYAPVCNGETEAIDDAESIVLFSGDTVTDVNALITFRQPDVAPQPVSLDELDTETYLALQDQIEILTRDSGSTVVQLDPDMAGQWVAAELIPEGTTAPAILSPYQSPQPASFTRLFARALSIDVTAWLQVDADGKVEIPNSMLAADQSGQIALLSSTSNLLGWTDLAAVETGGGTPSSGTGTSTTPKATSTPTPAEAAVTPLVTEESVEKTSDTGVEATSSGGAGSQVNESTTLILGGGLVLAVLVAGVSIVVRRVRRIR